MVRKILLTLFVLLCLVPGYAVAQEQNSTPNGHGYHRAVVKKINYQKNDQSGGNTIILADLEIQDNNRQGQEVYAEWSNEEQGTRAFKLSEGKKVIIYCDIVEGDEVCNIIDQQRIIPLLVLGILFLVIVWSIGKMQGLKAVMMMLVGILVILYLIVPLILYGLPPLLVTILGGLLIIIPTIYISHGFNEKSHIALSAIGIVCVIIGLLALGFSTSLGLVGISDDASLYLNNELSLRAILLSSILIGTLGVVDDLAITQISVVNELYHTNSHLKIYTLFTKAMHVGKDHIASVVNTLFLAYAGAAFPLLLLIQQNNVPAFIAIQQERVVTEILRIGIGTIGLVLVVPLATYIAAYFIVRYPNRFPKGVDAHKHGHAH